jgi:DNA-binding GntR family transcriptional regulator
MQPCDRLRYLGANSSLHATMIDGSGNCVLRSQTWPLLFTSRSSLMLGVSRIAQAIEEHEAIFEVVCGGKPAQAERAARGARTYRPTG